MKSNGGSLNFSFEEPKTLEEKIPLIIMQKKARRSMQRHKTFSGTHEWRRNESSALQSHGKGRHTMNTKPSSDVYNGDFEPRSHSVVLATSAPETQTEPQSIYNLFLRKFGSYVERVLKEYSIPQALIIQKQLERESLYLPDLIDAGVFVTEKGTLYLLDKRFEAVLAAQGIAPQQFRGYEKIGVLDYHKSRNGGFVFVTVHEEDGIQKIISQKNIAATRNEFKPDPVKPSNGAVLVSTGHGILRNIFEGHYRNRPGGHHNLEHALEHTLYR